MGGGKSSTLHLLSPVPLLGVRGVDPIHYPPPSTTIHQLAGSIDSQNMFARPRLTFSRAFLPLCFARALLAASEEASKTSNVPKKTQGRRTRERKGKTKRRNGRPCRVRSAQTVIAATSQFTDHSPHPTPIPHMLLSLLLLVSQYHICLAHAGLNHRIPWDAPRGRRLDAVFPRQCQCSNFRPGNSNQSYGILVDMCGH